MTLVTDCLHRLPRQPWSFVLHLGAGQTDLAETYVPLQPTRLVLVEGDADSARALTEALPLLAGAEVIEQAVSPAGGDLHWLRYNLRSLNGPLPAQGLATYYPRLRGLPGIELASLPVAVLVDRLLPAADAAPDGAATTGTSVRAGKLLVLDLPGQELALLEALGVERLHRFDQVVVHGRTIENGVGNTFAAAWEWLRAAHVAMEPRPADAPRRLWDAAWGRIDHRALEIETLRSQMARLQALLLHGSSRETELSSRLDTTANALTLTARQRDEQILWLEENAQWAKGLDDELRSLRAQKASEVAEARAQAEQAGARLRELEQELEQRSRALDQVHEEASHLREDLQAKYEAAQAKVERLTAELASAHHPELEHELERRAAALGQAQEQLSGAQAEIARLTSELAAAAAARDEQKHWHHENAKWAKGLDAELKKLRPAHEQLQAQVDQQTARARAAETEIEQLKAELTAARNRADTDRQEREALEVQLARVAKERDTEAHWHRENAKWAQGLKAELDPLKPELERLRRELDIAHREATEARSRADAQRREIDERDARQRLMDTEIVRVDAQLDLIKQVLIREKNF